MCIVAAVDGAEHAERIAREAAALAAAFDLELHVVNVLTRSRFVEIEHGSYEKRGETVPVERVRNSAQEIAERSATSLSTPPTCVGLVGDIATETLEYADEHDARYVVVGGRRRSPVGKAIFDSVTQDILLRAERPVVTVMRD
ncbi:universal stress protein [Halobellus sp. Atlit-31R]|nr:universal stress protein [Halobellus sp. Atlit-31R]